MNVDKLKELRNDLGRDSPPNTVLAAVSDVIKLIDILIESEATVGGGNGAQASVCGDGAAPAAPADPRDELIQDMLPYMANAISIFKTIGGAAGCEQGVLGVSEQGAIKQWNTRATPDYVKSLVGALKDIIPLIHVEEHPIMTIINNALSKLPEDLR